MPSSTEAGAAPSAPSSQPDTPPGPDSAAPAHLDPQALQALRDLDRSGQLMPRLVAAFERSVDKLQPALFGADPSALAAALHTLRAAAAQMGAQELARNCQTLEAEARQGRIPPGAQAGLRDLLHAARRAVQALR